MVKHIECHECGAENRVILGDFSIVRDSGTVEIHELNMHGGVELGSGESLPDALRDTADLVEGGCQ